MGELLRKLLRQPLVRVLLIIAGLTLIIGAGWGVFQTQKSPEQPIEFPHNRHVGLGIQCLYCHPGAWKGESAGLPTQSKCWACHQQIAKESPELDKLAEYVSTGQQIPWVPVAIVPDFVQFMHRPHIAAGLNCENCHGEISEMTVAVPHEEMNMGWCLSCHIEKSDDDHEMLTKLTDCTTCQY